MKENIKLSARSNKIQNKEDKQIHKSLEKNNKQYELSKKRASINLIKTKISKQDICDFYINLLRKLELIRFTLNFSELNQSENKFNNRSF